jgi:hypothetical protein
VVLSVLWYSVRVRQWWCEERDLCTVLLIQPTVVLAVLWYSVRVRLWWCEEGDVCTTDTDLQWCWLCCGTQLG